MGYIERMETERAVKKIAWKVPVYKKKKGRSRNRRGEAKNRYVKKLQKTFSENKIENPRIKDVSHYYLHKVINNKFCLC